MKRDGACTSLWQHTAEEYRSRKQAMINQLFDVVIAGGGITGLTTGLLLQEKGMSVLIAEAQSPGFGTTGGTTAHLNTFLDTPYHVVQKNFGEKNAQLLSGAVQNALKLIGTNVADYNIACDYRELAGYLFSQNADQSKELRQIMQASEECNVRATWAAQLPVPIEFENVIRFPGQASFHPLRYLMSLAKEFERAGGILLRNCRITSVEEGLPHTIITNQGNFRSAHFIYATHIPPGVNILHFRCVPYRSYAIALKLESRNNYPDALIYDMYDPYHYYRSQEIDGESYFIAGGEDHKTGHVENTGACLRRLEAHVKKYFAIRSIVDKWSSQYFEPADGLPYIGSLPGHQANMYVATGYGGNGMVYSAVAARLLTDIITGKENEYQELFDPNRIKLVAGFNNVVKASADVTARLIRKILPAEKLNELSNLAHGEARIVHYDGHRLAIYKDDDGRVYALNSACTHIRCEVSWNNAEKTWDCPCHGSRFSYTGEMLTGPARKDLEQVLIGIEEKIRQ